MGSMFSLVRRSLERKITLIIFYRDILATIFVERIPELYFKAVSKDFRDLEYTSYIFKIFEFSNEPNRGAIVWGDYLTR